MFKINKKINGRVKIMSGNNCRYSVVGINIESYINSLLLAVSIYYFKKRTNFVEWNC